jgi:hypothetical protein
MMHDAKKWLFACLVMAAFGGGVTLLNMTPSETVEAQERLPPGDMWRNHDGHWSYWHAGDKRWYYTDGTHWFFHNGTSWALYPFDKLFGRDFHHGDYKVPERDVPVPSHHVFR